MIASPAETERDGAHSPVALSEARPSRQPEEVSGYFYGVTNDESYPDTLTPTTTWLAGEAPDIGQDPDGLSEGLAAVKKLPRCLFNGRPVMYRPDTNSIVDFAVPCRQRKCVRCHVTRLLDDQSRVTAHVASLQDPLFFAVEIANDRWDTFSRRQRRREGRINYVRIPIADRFLVLGASTKEIEDEWQPIVSIAVLRDVWAWHWIRLPSAPTIAENRGRTTFTPAWTKPKTERTDQEVLGVITDPTALHSHFVALGGSVEYGSVRNVSAPPDDRSARELALAVLPPRRPK